MPFPILVRKLKIQTLRHPCFTQCTTPNFTLWIVFLDFLKHIIIGELKIFIIVEKTTGFIACLCPKQPVVCPKINNNYMTLGSKAFDPLMLTDFFAFHAHEILKDSKSAHFSTKNGYFLMFCGSQSHLFSCKQENR